MMRVLVVGGAGYIGSHTARAVTQHGHEPIILDSLSTGHRQFASKFTLIEADIRDGRAVREALRNVDAIMHFAAHAYVSESVGNPRKYFDNNMRGGLTLLDAALDTRVRHFVFSSSCTVYGVPAEIPIREGHNRQPISPYGRTKVAFEYALEDYARAYGLKVAILRYFNAAGADDSGEIGEMHDPETHLIPLALAAAAGRIPTLHIFGTDYSTPDGTCVRDYVHVSDLADAHVRALDYIATNGESLTVNLGTGVGYSVQEVIAMVEQVTGKCVPITNAPRREGDPAVLIADPSLAALKLSWRAGRRLENMIATAWNWMQKRPGKHSFLGS
jgi:UDP-glucose-4-epimerase GalE